MEAGEEGIWKVRLGRYVMEVQGGAGARDKQEGVGWMEGQACQCALLISKVISA